MAGDNMMKKGIIFIIFIVFVVLGIQTKEVSSDKTYQTIPDEAIRLRILANSDDEKDQHIKRLVRDDVNEYITEMVEEIDDIKEARATIDASVPEIKKIVEETLTKAGLSQSFTVEYRSNVTFPMKVYDNYVYPAGEYEAVLISIGEGKGSNWWCVLFPPLCFLDFSNGSTVANSDEESMEEDLDEDQEEDLEEDMDEIEESEVVKNEEADEDSDEEEIEVKFFLFEWLGLS